MTKTVGGLSRGRSRNRFKNTESLAPCENDFSIQTGIRFFSHNCASPRTFEMNGFSVNIFPHRKPLNMILWIKNKDNLELQLERAQSITSRNMAIE